MKLLKLIVLAGVILVIGVIGIVVLSLDGIIRSVVQTQATSSLNLPTTLGGVHISLLGGSVGLSDLSIGSPAGFTAPAMFSLGSAGVNVSYGELRNNPVKIDTITIDKPKLVIEEAGGKINLEALKSQTASPSSPPPASTPSGGQTMKLIINKLTVTNCDVVIRLGDAIPGVPSEIPLTVPNIELDNIGNADGAQNGAAIGQVVNQLLTAIESKAGDSSQLPAPVKALLSGDLSGIENQAKAEVGKSIDALKKGDTSAAKNALNGLLGGKGN